MTRYSTAFSHFQCNANYQITNTVFGITATTHLIVWHTKDNMQYRDTTTLIIYQTYDYLNGF